ncbi:acyl-ACP--UDP-N-acetylglucosamine O-acyltransferase [Pokkaliibacter plantistimulans]|uniref:acyl-ACP--UDP-N-acetylglucosamine O-acyltransferase n=1 Tax=Pokkaliibacter plantistimulans TaxID=1635171 RepID=UPI000D744653|nr:acyl-ACP--UDP-N-acetylglucosamine O-acyltransferase [Pokkaliibacter plantistimulans]
MIHPQAIVDPKAQLASDVEVGPWSYIGPDVTIDSGTVIHSHVVIKGPCHIGKDNKIFQFSSVGEECQDKKYRGEPTRLIIGDRNVIREGCTLHRGTVQDEGLTELGNDNLLMAYVHVAHDCRLGSNIILANTVGLAGHVKVGDWAILGGMAGVHQFCSIGAHAMIGGCSLVLKDVPAYVMASGNPLQPHGINVEGLKRRKFSDDALKTLRKAYKIVYRQGNTLDKAMDELQSMTADCPEIQLLLDSLQQASRGIAR